MSHETGSIMKDASHVSYVSQEMNVPVDESFFSCAVVLTPSNEEHVHGTAE